MTSRFLSLGYVSLHRMSLFPATVQLMVNLDKDAKERPTGVDLPPVTLAFQKPPDHDDAGVAAAAGRNSKTRRASQSYTN